MGSPKMSDDESRKFYQAHSVEEFADELEEGNLDDLHLEQERRQAEYLSRALASGEARALDELARITGRSRWALLRQAIHDQLRKMCEDAGVDVRILDDNKAA
jgi:hypothetical protein